MYSAAATACISRIGVTEKNVKLRGGEKKKKKEKAVPLLEELLQAVTFLIWFVLAWCVRKSSLDTVLALRVAFGQSGNYKKEKILDTLKLRKDLF